MMPATASSPISDSYSDWLWAAVRVQGLIVFGGDATAAIFLSCGQVSEEQYNQYFYNSMEVFEWQERDHSTPILAHVIAGSLAGISEHLSMIPIDNVKTHCQVAKRYSISQIVRKIYGAGGLANFYAGSSIVAFGCAPAHAIYFSIYERALERLGCHGGEDFGKLAVVGAVSAMFHDLIMTPTEVLKQRVQLMRSENLKVSIVQVVSSVLRREGTIAFYRSFPVNYAMNIPFGSLIVAFNETLKHRFGVADGDHGLKYYFCGGIAGAIASIPTTPLDVIKTKLNTQNCTEYRCDKLKVCNILRGKSEPHPEVEVRPRSANLLMQAREGMSTYRESVKYRNFLDAACKIMQEDGAMGFFKGLQMRMAIQSISSGVAWGTYQLIKDLLILQNKY